MKKKLLILSFPFLFSTLYSQTNQNQDLYEDDTEYEIGNFEVIEDDFSNEELFDSLIIDDLEIEDDPYFNFYYEEALFEDELLEESELIEDPYFLNLYLKNEN